MLTKLEYLKALDGRGIPNGPYRVLVGVFNYTNKFGEHAYPGEQRLAENTGMAARTVRDHLKWLTVNGYLIKGRRGHGGGKATKYAVGIDFRPMVELGAAGENSPVATGEDPWDTGIAA